MEFTMVALLNLTSINIWDTGISGQLTLRLVIVTRVLPLFVMVMSISWPEMTMPPHVSAQLGVRVGVGVSVRVAVGGGVSVRGGVAVEV